MSAQVHVTFFTVVILFKSIERLFFGGAVAFDIAYPGAKSGSELRGLTVMSGSDLDDLLAELEAQGLLIGEDLAVGEMFHGEWVDCPGIEFIQSKGAGRFPAWSATTTELAAP